MGLTFWFIKDNRRFGLFCLAWFVLNLLPMTLSMISGGFMLDHWGYTMAPAVLLPMGYFFERQWALHRKSKTHAALAGLFFPVLILWALLTHLNVELRNTDEKLFRWSLHFTSSAPLQHNLGVVLLQQGRAREALPYFENVRARYPEDLNNTYLLARAYFEARHSKIAILLLQSLAHQTPPYEPAVRALQSIKRG
jgi:tetratricopeptide (TPR) repeat protein